MRDTVGVQNLEPLHLEPLLYEIMDIPVRLREDLSGIEGLTYVNPRMIL